MKKAFFEYVGAEDSLFGYQKSNRLVLLKALFSRIDQEGKVLVSDIVQLYKDYYITRKSKGLVPDVGADVVINSIETATNFEILKVIKRHPYRVLNERGYLSINTIGGIEYFVLNPELVRQLTPLDFDLLRSLVDKKLILYFDNIDIYRNDNLVVDTHGRDYSDHNSTDKIITIVDKFIQYNGEPKLISLNNPDLEFTESDLHLINENTDLFFLCTSKSALLVIWVIDVIDRKFTGHTDKYDINAIYEFLRLEFSVNKFNKNRLMMLLECKDQLTFSDFKKIKNIARKKILNIYNIDRGFPDPVKLHTGKLKEQINSGKLKKRIEVLLGLVDNIDNLDLPLSKDEHELLHKAERAILEIGEDLCKLCYQNPGKIVPVIHSLSDFSGHIITQQQRLETLRSLMSNISEKNMGAKVKYLFKVFYRGNRRNSSLTHFECCKHVSDMYNIISLVVENEETFLELKNFLLWLEEDFEKQLYSAITKIFKNERDFEVVAERAKGYSLEEVGNKFGLTRERIRQVESKVEGRFKSFYSAYNPGYIIISFSESDICLYEKDYQHFFGKYTPLFTHLIQKISLAGIAWKKEMGCCIVGDCQWYEDIMNKIEELPGQYPLIKIKELVKELLDNCNIDVNDDIIETIIMSSYKQVGDYLFKKRATKKEMYRIIVEKYYPDGIKLFDDFEMLRFKTRLQDTFGDIDFKGDNTRAISTRITDFTILCDRGKYILPTAIQINSTLLDEIHEFIVDHDRSSIMFGEIFEHFKVRLLNESNIHNRYFLQGVLRYYWNDEFSFSRDILSRDSIEERNIRRHIEIFIKDSNRIVSIREIKEKFCGITDIVVNLALSENSDILQWGLGEYIHSALLNINTDDLSKFKQALEVDIFDGTVSVRALFERMFERDQILLSRYRIYNHIALFSIYQYMFPEEYNFNRPYISNRGTTGTTDSIIAEYVGNFTELLIDDLRNFTQAKHLKITNFSAILDKNCSEFLRVDEVLLIRTNTLSITDNVIESVENSVMIALGDKGYMPAKCFEDFFFFPYIGIKWTPWLLVSFIKKYCSKIDVSQYVTDYRYLNEVIFNTELNVSNHEELLIYAIQFENGKERFKSIEDVESFLRAEGLLGIKSNIPPVLFEFDIINKLKYSSISD